ncbi:MAG TPA: pitrilysin family protein [Candidatus Heimdallarchaeota archaeon]|nr:pitrilysin family protein [Candidatus Heimdallarchaeota archaeon]
MITPLYEGAFTATLTSGLQVLVEEIPSSRCVSVGIWIKVGSRDDPPSRKGLAHFLEHLLFKGTATRDAARIAREIDAVGGYLNGATGKESSFYYAEVPADGLPVAIEILADLVQHPAFESQEIERERGVVLEEIRGRDDDPEQVAFDLFIAGLWEKDHPLTWPVLGARKTIADVLRKEVAQHHRAFYRPGNMVLVACGAVKARSFIEQVERLFDGSVHPSSRPARVAPQMQSGCAVYERDTGQTHLYVGLPGTEGDDEDRIPLEVVNTVLGDGMSSRLFRIVREERGLAYVISSSVSHYSDVGSWIVYAGIAPENAAEVMSITRSEIACLQQEGAIRPDELSLAKAKLRGNLVLSLETDGNRMARLGSAVVTGREILSPDELVRRLEAVSSEDVARVIARFARPEALNLAVIGPHSGGIEGI